MRDNFTLNRYCIPMDQYHRAVLSVEEKFFDEWHCYDSPLSFPFWTYLFFSHDYSSFPRHRPADYTCLCNCFLLSTSLDFYDSSLLTHCASSQFQHIPPCSNCFVIVPDFPESLVYKPSTCYVFPKLDLLCTLVHCYTNLVLFSFSHPWLFVSLHQCSELVTHPWNSSPTSRKSLGCIFKPLTLT